MKVYLLICTYQYDIFSSRKDKYISPVIYETREQAALAAVSHWPEHWHDRKFYIKSVKV